MDKVTSFEDLVVFQDARNLCRTIYLLTNNEPFKYDARFVQQIRAAVGSVMDNIAEGYDRQGNKELVNFLYIAKGSCGEVRSQLIRAHDVGFIDDVCFSKLFSDCKKLSASLMNFIKEIKISEFKGTKYI